MTAVELAIAGEAIMAGKGTCFNCHTIGSGADPASLRFPDLGGIGRTAATREPGLSAVEYLAKSLYEPNEFIVEGFLPGMPIANRPPIGLSDDEIKAVLNYMLGLGSEPSLTLASDIGYVTEESATPSGGATAAAGVGSGLDGPGVIAAYLCGTCHAVDDDSRLMGPSLFDIGARLSKAEIYEAIMDPDATVPEGFPGAVMGATLEASGFFQKVSTEELRALVDYLASKTGE